MSASRTLTPSALPFSPLCSSQLFPLSLSTQHLPPCTAGARVMWNRACRILSTPENSPPTGKSATAAAVAKLSESERVSMWRSLFIKISLVFQMIATQTKTKMLLGDKVFHSLFPIVQGKVNSQPPTPFRIIKGQVVGKLLPRGEGKKDALTAHMDPAMCSHQEPDMVARANKQIQWWTCKKCQSRWERAPMDNWLHLDSPPLSEDLVIFGKYMGSTYKEVLTDAPYCQWVMTTVDAGEASAPLHRLAKYIHQQSLEATFEADGFDMEL